MKLIVRTDDGVDFIVTEDIQDYDLNKSVAASQIILDLNNTFIAIKRRPQYEVVDMTPGMKLPNAVEAYNAALERKHYWMGQCVNFLDEANIHNCAPDGGVEAVDKAQTWQDRVIRIMSGNGIQNFKVDRTGLTPNIIVCYDDGIVEHWRD